MSSPQLHARFVRAAASAGLLVCLVSPSVHGAPGDLDLTFGDGGIVTTDFIGSNIDDVAPGVAVQPDGKVVVTGTTNHAGGQDLALFRLNVDGSLDASFGDGGTVSTDFPGTQNEQAHGVALLPDGRIVMVGGSQDWPGWVLLACYTSDGQLDAGFGDGGFVTPEAPSIQWMQGTAVTVDAEGRILVAGTNGSTLLLARYLLIGRSILGGWPEGPRGRR